MSAVAQVAQMTGGDRVIALAERMVCPAGSMAGSPFIVYPWQAEGIIRPIFDPVDAAGRRKVRVAVITLPRKNGKTGVTSILSVYGLAFDGEPQAEIVLAANSKDQARILFRMCKNLVEKTPELSARIEVVESRNRLVHRRSGSFLHVVSADVRLQHGSEPHFVIYDELGQAKSADLWQTLTGGQGARVQPLAIAISTLGPKHPGNPLLELRDYGEQIGAGTVVDDSFHFLYHGAADDLPWDEEDTWRIANPAIESGFRDIEEIRRAALKAKRLPSYRSWFEAYYLNREIDARPQFIAPADWLAGKGYVDIESLRGRRAWAGLDLSSTTDITALVLLVEDDDGFTLLPWFWVPADTVAERTESQGVPYRQWVDMELITATPGRAIDRRSIAIQMAEVAAMFDLQLCAYDRWRIEDLRRVLDDEGIDVELHPHGQGFKDMSVSLDRFEELVLAGKIRHDGNPVFTWMLSNVAIDTDPAGGRKPSKRQSKSKIDGVVAAIMSCGAMMQTPEPTAPRVWVVEH